jgi:hypothetical protein
MAFSDSVSLLFKLKAQNDASPVFENFRKDVKKELDAIDDASKSGFSSFAKNIGLSAEQTASLSKALPVASAAIAGISAAAFGAGAALFSLAKQAADYGSEIQDAREKTGLAAETLSALRYAGEQGGKGLAEITAGLARFSKTIDEAAHGSKEAAEKLERLGIDPKKAFNDLDGALADVIKRIYELPPGVKQMTAAQNAFGKSGADLIVTINATKGDLKAFREEAERLGLVLSNEDAEAADKFGDLLVQLKAQISGVSYAIGKEFIPIFTDMAKDVSEWLVRNKGEIKDWSRDFALGLRRAADTAKGFAVELEEGRFFETMAAIDEIIKKYHPVHKLGEYLRKRGQGNALKNQFGAIIEAMNPPESDDKKDDSDIEKTKAELEKQRKAREKAYKDYIQDLSRFNQTQQKVLQENYERANKQNEDAFKAQSISEQEYQNNSIQNLRIFIENSRSLLSQGFKLETKGKSKTQVETLSLEYSESLRKLDELERTTTAKIQENITEVTKKASETRAKKNRRTTKK